MQKDDELVWADVVRGGGDAFGVIFDRHHSRVTRHARGLAAQAADADDIAAVVFLEAWRLRERVRFVNGSMLPWLLRVTTNVSFNVARSARRYRRALAQLPASEPSPDHALARDDGELLAALRLLPPHEREVLVLCLLEGLTPTEAATALDIQPGTARSRLSRGKTRLRRAVSGTDLDRLEVGEAHV